MSQAAAPAQARLFRKVALERLSSPEELDSLVQVVTPRAWLAITPFVALLLLALAWGIFGSIPTKVSGRAILLQAAGLHDITSGAAGRITELQVRVGDRVAPGQPVARLAQPQLEEQLRATRERLAELERQQALQQTQTGRALALSRGLLDQQRAALERQIAAAQQRARVTAERVATQEALLEQGLITRQALLNTQNELAAAQQEVENSRASLQQASLRSAEDDKRASAELAALGLQIGEARRQLAALQASRSEASQVLSSFAGRVVELKVGAGALVAPGAALVTIEPQAGPGTGTLEAVIYVPAADGKKVEPGMTVQLVPSTVKREEHGYMVGHVHSVSDYVATGEAIASLLQNRQLAQELAGGSSAIEVRAALEESPTASGYRWSSGSGPPYRVRPGTLAQAEVVVYRQPPVTLVIPLLKKWLGLD